MPLRYVRVKDTRTGHQFDVLEERVDPDRHKVLTSDRYPVTGRPRPAKPLRSKGGGSTTRGPSQVELTERTPIDDVRRAAEDAGVDHTGLNKKQILAAIAEVTPNTATE